MEHKQLKEILLEQAKQMGLSKQDAKILSTDPFFVGTDGDYRNAQWAASLWDKMMARRKKPLHLRGFHYWIQSQGIQKPEASLLVKEKKQGKKPDKYAYVDPAKDWLYLLGAAQVARYLGIGKWEGLMDLKHPNPSDYDNYFVGSGFSNNGEVDIQNELNGKLSGLVDEFLQELLSNSPRYHTAGYQLYHMEVWCEKNSMGFVIEPTCRRYDACYQPLTGQSSIEKVNMAYARCLRAARAGKKVRIFYIADWDRYGWSMVSAVARKLEFYAIGQDLDIKLTRLALNDNHIKQFQLPRAPKLGEAVVELDALEAIHPGELGKIVVQALDPYYDEEKVKIVEAENRRIREKARELLSEKLREPLEGLFSGLDLEGAANGFSLADTLNEDFEAPEPKHEVEEDNSWLYDSNRDYWIQWERYKEYKGERKEEEV